MTFRCQLLVLTSLQSHKPSHEPRRVGQKQTRAVTIIYEAVIEEMLLMEKGQALKKNDLIDLLW